MPTSWWFPLTPHRDHKTNNKPPDFTVSPLFYTLHNFRPHFFSSALILTFKGYLTKPATSCRLIACKLNSKHTEGNLWALMACGAQLQNEKGDWDLLNRVIATQLTSAVSDPALFFWARMCRSTAQQCLHLAKGKHRSWVKRNPHWTDVLWCAQQYVVAYIHPVQES